MPRVTFTLPPSSEPVAEQLARLLGDLPVLPSGALDDRTITLTGDWCCLVAALYLCHSRGDYMRAHELVSQIKGTP